MCAWCALASAGVGDWKTYTAKREVRDLAEDRGVVWAATAGGMFSYRFSDSTFNQFTTSEGLKTIDLTAIAVDGSGAIWAGAQNGFLHRYLPSKNEWQYVADIALRADPFKRINALRVSGDTLFICSDIGLSLFSISKMEFGNTYASFGSSPNQITGNVTTVQLFQGQLWAGTRNGIASTSMTNPNPSAPESWQVYATAQGLPSNTISSLQKFHDPLTGSDTLFVSTGSGILYFDVGTWNSVPGTAGLNIVDMSFIEGCPSCTYPYQSEITFITPTQLGSIQGTKGAIIDTTFHATSQLTKIIIGNFLIGTFQNGFELKNYSYGDRYTVNIFYKSIFPPGPSSNKFIGLAVDNKGAVWSGTGVANADGFMSFDRHTWRSYTAQQDSRLGTNDYYKVNIGKDNAKWVSGWGPGVVLLDDGGTIRKVFNTTNGLSPSIDPSFLVVGGVATDENGVAWIVDRTGRGDTTLIAFSPDSSLGYAHGLSTRNPITAFTDIVIDGNGTKWFANFSRFEGVLPTGLFFYNERFALPGTINGWGKVTSVDGLTTNKIYSLAIGNDGDLWVGSDEGISIIYNPGSPFSIASYHPLRDQVIQGIVVDPVNNKWIATKQGVFLLSSDGTTIINRYTVENTEGKLLDNDVASIAIDGTTGTMYFGTEKGLSSLRTGAVTPNRSFNGLSFAPNPFLLPSSSLLTIDGLVQGSSLKILSVDGDLIRELRTSGGRVGFWDGKNERGEFVSSGVYLVVAYSEDGSKVAAGKVAVIRK
jgi:ligand-binding sensor domain-containing protein